MSPPGVASQAHSEFEVDITQVDPVPQAVMLPEPAYAPFTQQPLDQYPFLASPATQPPIAIGTSSLQKSFPAAVAMAKARQVNSSEQKSWHSAWPEARGSSAADQVPQRGAFESRADSHSRPSNVAPAGVTRQSLSPADTLPIERPLKRKGGPGGGKLRTSSIPGSSEVIASAQRTPPGGSAQKASPAGSVQKNLLGSNAALGSSPNGTARHRSAAGQPGNPALVTAISSVDQSCSKHSSPAAQSPHNGQQQRLPASRSILSAEIVISLEDDETPQHPPVIAQHAPTHYSTTPPTSAACKSGLTPAGRALQQDAHLPANGFHPTEKTHDLPAQSLPIAKQPAGLGVPQPQGTKQPTMVHVEANACLGDASMNAVPKPLQASRPRLKAMLRDLGLPPTGANPEGDALGPHRMRQPPPAFLSGKNVLNNIFMNNEELFASHLSGSHGWVAVTLHFTLQVHLSLLVINYHRYPHY